MEALLQQHADLLRYMYHEGVVNKQFLSLHRFRNAQNPEFMRNLSDLYYKGAEKKLKDVASELKTHEVNFARISEIVENLRDTSLSYGVQGVIDACNAFRTCYRFDNYKGCLRCVEHLKDEYFLMKRRVETLLQLEQQIKANGVGVPVIERPSKRMKRMFNP